LFREGEERGGKEEKGHCYCLVIIIALYISTLFFSVYVQVDDGGSMKDEVRQD
jgi:hypothetical protein